MDILSKHKKKGLQGFKEFIYYLELADTKRVTDILAIAWLEDPVYAQFLEPNLVKFDYFLKKLNPKDHERIFMALPNGPQTFTFAFKGSQEHEEIISKLNPLIARKIGFAEESVPEITVNQRAEARNILIKKMRDLQDHNEVSPYPWKLPSEKVVKGEHFLVPANGHFQLKYETGILALEGGFEKKIRAGLWNHYHPNGKLFAKGHYSEGEKFGKWSFFDLEGKLKAEGQYIENLRSGSWHVFDDKAVASTVAYERGRLI